MGQISKGTTFITGQQVTAANLNNLVDNATLLPTAITAQTQASTVADTNLLLTTPSSGASLNKISLSTIVTSLSLAKTTGNQSFSGNLTMVSGADIALTSQSILSLPAGATQTLASGSSLTLSSGAILTLGQDPVSGLQAVTKNYADNNFLNKNTGNLNHSSNGSDFSRFRRTQQTGITSANSSSRSFYGKASRGGRSNINSLFATRGWSAT